MKRNILLVTVLFAFVMNASAKDSIIKDVFEQFVEDKIERMQKLIHFNDKQADQLKELEITFLLDVNKAENRILCRKKRRIKKLKKQRDKDLQLILTREQYIKYNVIDNDLIKEDPPIQV